MMERELVKDAANGTQEIQADDVLEAIDLVDRESKPAFVLELDAVYKVLESRFGKIVPGHDGHDHAKPPSAPAQAAAPVAAAPRAESAANATQEVAVGDVLEAIEMARPDPVPQRVAELPTFARRTPTLIEPADLPVVTAPPPRATPQANPTQEVQLGDVLEAIDVAPETEPLPPRSERPVAESFAPVALSPRRRSHADSTLEIIRDLALPKRKKLRWVVGGVVGASTLILAIGLLMGTQNASSAAAALPATTVAPNAASPSPGPVAAVTLASPVKTSAAPLMTSGASGTAGAGKKDVPVVDIGSLPLASPAAVTKTGAAAPAKAKKAPKKR